MEKTHKPITARKKSTKSNRPLLVQDGTFVRDYPIPKSVILKLAEDQIEWAKRPDSLVMSKFHIEHNLSERYFGKLLDEHPELKTAYEFAKAIVAARREEGMLTRKFDSGSTMRSMPMYSDDWKKFEEWRASLRAKEENSHAPQVIILDRMPTVEAVKTRSTE